MILQSGAGLPIACLVDLPHAASAGETLDLESAADDLSCPHSPLSSRFRDDLKRLYTDAQEQRYIALIRVEAGVYYPGHWHKDVEEIYLLEGELSVRGQTLVAMRLVSGPRSWPTSWPWSAR